MSLKYYSPEYCGCDNDQSRIIEHPDGAYVSRIEAEALAAEINWLRLLAWGFKESRLSLICNGREAVVDGIHGFNVTLDADGLPEYHADLAAALERAKHNTGGT